MSLQEMQQFQEKHQLARADDIVAVHEKCKEYMEEERINNSDEWLDEVDEIIFNFKRKVHSWLKEINEDDKESFKQIFKKKFKIEQFR